VRRVAATRGTRTRVVAIAALAAIAVLPAGARAGGIQSIPPPIGLKAFTGLPAVQHPVYYPAPPADPFMAPNGRSNIHDDAYMSNTNEGPGPLGNGLGVSSYSTSGDCGSVTFDSRGRIVTVCVGVAGPKLELLDPHSLGLLASFTLPGRVISSKLLNVFQDFGGGGYFYLDNHDRAVIPTTSRHIEIVGETAGATPGFQLIRDYDLSTVVHAGDEITSVLPDWSGRLWFESFDGVVGTIDPASGRIRSIDTHEETENSFALDETGGVYIVTIKALYRYDAGPQGQPTVTWRMPYPNSGIHKPGQVDAGSGTTPLLMGSRYVAIADNADPLDIVVYRRARHVTGSRVVCVHPVFNRGSGDTENSLIGTANAMVIENNYGYTGPQSTTGGATTAAGLTRVDINANGRGCHTVWTSIESAPTVVPKLSLSSGLVYTYTKPANPLDPWYFTALSFATGNTVYQQLAGDGIAFNNNYAPVTLGPDGSAYVGVLDGLVAFRDASPPPFLTAKAPAVRRPAGHHRRRRRHRRA
jgi:hypothetical protein